MLGIEIDVASILTAGSSFAAWVGKPVASRHGLQLLVSQFVALVLCEIEQLFGGLAVPCLFALFGGGILKVHGISLLEKVRNEARSS